MILVSFRFDDSSLVSNHKLEKDIFITFEKHNINLCVGVVPFFESSEGVMPFSLDKAEHLVDALKRNVIEIALHGYSHTQRSKTNNGAPSEFVSLSKEKQTYLIQQGRLHLSNLFETEINCFIPPYNTYDSVTEKVLSDECFAHLSAGPEIPHTSKFSIPKMPVKTHLYNARAAIEQAMLYTNLNPIITILFHHYDFKESHIDKAVVNLEKLDELLGWIKVNGMIMTVPLSTAVRAFKKFDIHHYQYQQLIKRLPHCLRWRLEQNPVFLCPTWKIFLNILPIKLFSRKRKMLWAPTTTTKSKPV